MFVIDLLKGEGIPATSRPQGIAITAAAFAMPVIVIIVLFGLFRSNAAAISVQRQQVDHYQQKTGEFSEALAVNESFEKERNTINSVLSEVSASVHRHIQWSPVIVTLVENIPDSLLLTGLEVKQHNAQRKIPKKDDPETLIDTNVTITMLRIRVSSKSAQSGDVAVRNFSDSLRLSELLGPKLEDIEVSRENTDTKSGDDMVSYGINCVFKPQL